MKVVRVFSRLLLALVLLAVAVGSGTAVVLAAFFLLGDISERDPDRVLWICIFLACLVVGAPICAMSARRMVEACRHAFRDG